MLPMAGLLFVGLAATAVAANTWDSVAARFGCTQKIQEGEQANGSVFVMEFLPKDQKVGKHDRIFTITLTRLPEDDRAANEQAQRAMQSMSQAATRAGAKIKEFNGYPTNHGTVAFFDYTLNGEHNVGVVARTGPGILTVYQMAALGGKTVSDEDRQRLRQMIGLQ